MNQSNAQAIFRSTQDSEMQEWNHPTRGQVKWWDLINGDIMPTNSITMGLAEVPVNSLCPKRGHTHDAEEVYYFLEGNGRVHINGSPTDVQAGMSVWIPANAEHFCENIGTIPLKLLFVFARDKFSDIKYCFPGDQDSV